MRASWEKKNSSCGFQPKRQLSCSGRSEVHSHRRLSQECVQEWVAALRSCWKRPGLTLSPEKGQALHGLSEDHRGCPKTSGWLAGRKQKASSEATFPFPEGPLRTTGGALAPGPPRATAAQPRWFLPDSAPPFRHPCLWCALWWKRVREAESGPPHQFWNLPPPGRSRKAVGLLPARPSAPLPLLPAASVAASVYLPVSGEALHMSACCPSAEGSQAAARRAGGRSWSPQPGWPRFRHERLGEQPVGSMGAQGSPTSPLQTAFSGAWRTCRVMLTGP